MIGLTKQQLQDYINARRAIIDSYLKQGVIPGVIDSIELDRLHGNLNELKKIEAWFR